MKGKTPVLIGLLVEFILILLMVNTEGLFLKTVYVLLFAAAQLMVLLGVLQSKKWSFEEWYTFIVFMVMAVFLLVYSAGTVGNFVFAYGFLLLGTLIVNAIIVLPANGGGVVPKSGEFEKLKDDFMKAYSSESKAGIKEATAKLNEDLEKIEKKIDDIKVERKVFFAKKSGEKFHRAGCITLSNTKKDDLVKFSSAAEAGLSGYRPCKMCNPQG